MTADQESETVKPTLLITEGGRSPIWLTERQAQRIGFTETQIADAKVSALHTTRSAR